MHRDMYPFLILVSPSNIGHNTLEENANIMFFIFISLLAECSWCLYAWNLPNEWFKSNIRMHEERVIFILTACVCAKLVAPRIDQMRRLNFHLEL